MQFHRPTICDIARQLEGLYIGLVGEKTFRELLDPSSALSHRLSFLLSIIDGDVRQVDFDQDQSIQFFESLLAGVSLHFATGGLRDIFGPLQITDASLLGKSRFRRSDLLNAGEQLADWHFERLVQANLACQGLRVVDLKFDKRFKNERVCDFALGDASVVTDLLEVKRFHPNRRPRDNQVTAAADKVRDRLDSLVKQLENTARILGVDNPCYHAVIDISGYAVASRDVQLKAQSVRMIGFSPEEIDRVHREIASCASERLQDLHTLTICYNERIFVDGIAVAIVQRVDRRRLRPGPDAEVEYNGWTVEGYPANNSKCSEVRVSSMGRTIEWIRASYTTVRRPGKFARCGQPRSVE